MKQTHTEGWIFYNTLESAHDRNGGGRWTQRCELFLCVGTSTVVEPAAFLPFAALQA